MIHNKLQGMMFFMPSVFGNLIVNGGFENSAPVCTQNGGGWCLFDNPSLIAPWRFSGQPLYELDYTVWPASDAASGGKVSMDLSANGPVTIAQDVATTIGTKYLVSLDANNNGCGSTVNRTATVQATGGILLHFGHANGPRNAWDKVRYLFRATSNLTTISIASTDPSSCGVIVDNIQMIALNKCKI